MPRIHGGPQFQQECVRRLRVVLGKHGRTDVRFDRLTDGLDRFVARLEFGGRPHEIGVYADDVTMTAGKSLFECYMPDEFASEAAFIEGFAARLDRYLAGGPWAGPDEKDFPDSIREKLRRLIRR